MTLSIYDSPVATANFSTGGTFNNPMRHAVDGRVGGVIERLYYVRNDNSNRSYTDITLKAVSSVAKDIVSGADGYSIKLSKGSTQPTDQEWDTVDGGNTITWTSITEDTLLYNPFWLRIEVPKGAPVDTVISSFFRISGTESVV